MSSESEKVALARAAMELLDREIWIITAEQGERRGGLVATWVSWASIDPASPQVLISLARNHFTAELVAGSGRFAAHLITAAQLDLVWNFALGSGRDRDKLQGIPLQPRPDSPPILAACLLWLDCRVFQRLDAGDRLYFWADVVEGGQVAEGTPLRQQQALALATEAQRSQLDADRKRDIALLRPLHLRWRGVRSNPL